MSYFWTGFEKQAGIIKTAGVGWNTYTYTSPARTIRKLYHDASDALHDETSDKWWNIQEDLEYKHGKKSGPGNYKFNDHLAYVKDLKNDELRKQMNSIGHDHAYADKPTTNILDTKKDAGKIKRFLETYHKTLKENAHALTPEDVKAGQAFLEHAHGALKDSKVKSLAFEWE